MGRINWTPLPLRGGEIPDLCVRAKPLNPVIRESKRCRSARFQLSFPVENKGQQLRLSGSTGRRISRDCARRGRRCVGKWRQYHSLAAEECDVLFTVNHISDWRGHASAQPGLNVEQLFTFVGAVSRKVTVGQHLEHE